MSSCFAEMDRVENGVVGQANGCLSSLYRCRFVASAWLKIYHKYRVETDLPLHGFDLSQGRLSEASTHRLGQSGAAQQITRGFRSRCSC